MLRLLENRLRDKLDKILEESQSGFRKERWTNNKIFILRPLSKKEIRTRRHIHAYISLIWRKPSKTWNFFDSRGIEKG